MDFLVVVVLVLGFCVYVCLKELLADVDLHHQKLIHTRAHLLLIPIPQETKKVIQLFFQTCKKSIRNIWFYT